MPTANKNFKSMQVFTTCHLSEEKECCFTCLINYWNSFTTNAENRGLNERE